MLGLDCELRTFKVGINNVHSRGDREEVFGGIGQPSKGCFVGAIWFWLSLLRIGGRKTLRQFPRLYATS